MMYYLIRRSVLLVLAVTILSTTQSYSVAVAQRNTDSQGLARTNAVFLQKAEEMLTDAKSRGTAEETSTIAISRVREILDFFGFLYSHCCFL
jgi:hypothetical protein